MERCAYWRGVRIREVAVLERCPYGEMSVLERCPY